MIPEKMMQVLEHEGVVAIVTQGDKEPHVVNTWNSYLKVIDNDKILFPVGSMIVTESNIEKNNEVQVTLGSREVQGFHSPGTGFLIKGTMSFIKDGNDFELIKKSYPWARAAGEIKINSAVQTL